MFERFEKFYCCDNEVVIRNSNYTSMFNNSQLDELLSRFSGVSFNKGLYKVMKSEDIMQWNERVSSAFPAFIGKIVCFAYDWLGRVFAIDLCRLEDGCPGVLMFEPGTGESLEIPCDLSGFHDNELIDYRDAALADSFFLQWLASGGAVPKYDQCIGYKKPLFLGGKDTIENLKISDFDVYWVLMGQLIRKAKGLPVGTYINNITIE